MIPKVIHYCWFGGNLLPDFAQKCIASWKTYLPDYEVREWNESNFDLNCCDYVREAYQAQKWAFVSDYARFWILYHYGGLYFDTDVEIVRDMSNIIENGAFMGCEAAAKCGLGVNPGLGLGVNPGLGVYKEILEDYQTAHFFYKDGTYNYDTVVKRTTDVLMRYGFKECDEIQMVAGVMIYPTEYFAPYNYMTGNWNMTENTVSIHHYAATWHSQLEELIIKIERCEYSVHPGEYIIRRIISLPFRIVNKIKNAGIKGAGKTILNRLGNKK